MLVIWSQKLRSSKFFDSIQMKIIFSSKTILNYDFLVKIEKNLTDLLKYLFKYYLLLERKKAIFVMQNYCSDEYELIL